MKNLANPFQINVANPLTQNSLANPNNATNLANPFRQINLANQLDLKKILIHVKLI